MATAHWFDLDEAAVNLGVSLAYQAGMCSEPADGADEPGPGHLDCVRALRLPAVGSYAEVLAALARVVDAPIPDFACEALGIGIPGRR